MITKTIDLKGNWETREVWLNGKILSPEKSLAFRSHSPDGFSWSYPGSGPAQLALAICLELTGETFKDRKFGYPYDYQLFKCSYIATLPAADFNIKEMQVFIREFSDLLPEEKKFIDTVADILYTKIKNDSAKQ